jgi:hypothetical protein
LYAFNASNLAQELWDSGQAPNGIDSLGSVIKFASPTVANGMVYVGTGNRLVIYGLRTYHAPPASPTTGGANTSTSLLGHVNQIVSVVQSLFSWVQNALLSWKQYVSTLVSSIINLQSSTLAVLQGSISTLMTDISGLLSAITSNASTNSPLGQPFMSQGENSAQPSGGNK